MSIELEGWRPAIRQLVPWRATGSPPFIRTTRVLWIAFVGAILLILWVASTQLAFDGYPANWLVVWAAYSAAVGTVARVIRSKQLADLSRVDDRSRFLAGFRGAFFVTLGLTESVALAGLGISVLVGSLTPYLIAAPTGVALMTMAAPTTPSLNHLQGLVDEQGGSIRVAEVFMSPETS